MFRTRAMIVMVLQLGGLAHRAASRTSTTLTSQRRALGQLRSDHQVPWWRSRRRRESKRRQLAQRSYRVAKNAAASSAAAASISAWVAASSITSRACSERVITWVIWATFSASTAPT